MFGTKRNIQWFVWQYSGPRGGNRPKIDISINFYYYIKLEPEYISENVEENLSL